MIEIKYVKGNILDYIEEAQHIAHGCNCYHTMRSGVAKVLNKYTRSKLMEADVKTPYGDVNKLGSYSSCIYQEKNYYNLYTQHGYGKDGVYVHWQSVYDALYSLLDEEVESGDVVAIPAIGTGLAGGSQEDLEHTLDMIAFYENDLPDVKIIVCSL